MFPPEVLRAIYDQYESLLKARSALLACRLPELKLKMYWPELRPLGPPLELR